MIRRHFLKSVLGALGLGFLVPEAKTDDYYSRITGVTLGPVIVMLPVNAKDIAIQTDEYMDSVEFNCDGKSYWLWLVSGAANSRRLHRPTTYHFEHYGANTFPATEEVIKQVRAYQALSEIKKA